jgi:hypothetical protein
VECGTSGIPSTFGENYWEHLQEKFLDPRLKAYYACLIAEM